MLEAGASKGRDLRSEVHRIRSGYSRDRPRMWFGYFRAPHRHLVVNVTVTSARTNTNVTHIGARLPLPGNLVFGPQQGQLDADLRTSALLGSALVQSVHEYCPFALEDGGRLAPMAVELVISRPAIWVVICRFNVMGDVDSRSLRYYNYVCMQHMFGYLCYLSTFWGDVRREFHATSFCCSSWYFGFQSSRRFARGKC
jgi:hypothetical protein